MFGAPWDEVIAAHLRCCWAVASQNYYEAFQCQYQLVQSFAKVLLLCKRNIILYIVFS